MSEKPQRYGLWIDAEDYVELVTYEDGDVNIEVTEEQAETLVEKFGRCTTETARGGDSA